MLIILQISDGINGRNITVIMAIESLSVALSKKSIDNKIVNVKNLNDNLIEKMGNIKENDILLIPGFFFTTGEKIFDILNIGRKVIILNTESVYSPNCPWILDKNLLNNENLLAIWDYEHKNINVIKNFLKDENILKDIYYVPPLFTELYCTKYKLDNAKEKKIDILFYGSRNGRREKIVNDLTNLGYNVVFRTYKNIKYQYNDIESAKIVIIVHYHEFDKLINFYRISHLISNKIFIIHEDVQEEEKSESIYKHITFSKYEDFVNTCVNYLNKTQQERNSIAENVYEVFKNEYDLTNYIPM